MNRPARIITGDFEYDIQWNLGIRDTHGTVKHCPQFQGGLTSQVLLRVPNTPRDSSSCPQFPGCPYLPGGDKDRFHCVCTCGTVVKTARINECKRLFLSLRVFRCVNGITPSHLRDVWTPALSIRTRESRSPDDNLLYVPYANCDLFKQSFECREPALWNPLPIHLRMAPSVDDFKKRPYERIIF